MNEIDWVKSLKASASVVPEVDVSRGVMRELSRGVRPGADRAALWVWGIAAALGLTASTAAGVFAFTMWQASTDPAQAFASAWSAL